DGKFGKDLVPRMMARAREIAAEAPSYFTNQMHNTDMITGYRPLGEELVRQVSPLHTYCACVGTAGMLMGVARVIKAASTETRVLRGGEAGTHGVEGVAPGFVPPQYEASLVDEARGVDEVEGRRMAWRLSREEGVFAGTSTGLNVLGAIQLAREAGPGHTVV